MRADVVRAGVLALVIVARALFRRIDAACQIALWLLGIGVVASLLKGLDVEEALLLLLVMGTLWLGRSAFYRRASIIDSRLRELLAERRELLKNSRGGDRE